MIPLTIWLSLQSLERVFPPFTQVVAVLGGGATKPDVIDAGGIATDWPTVTFSIPSKGVSPIAVLDMDVDGFSDLVIRRSNGSSLDGFGVWGGGSLTRNFFLRKTLSPASCL